MSLDQPMNHVDRLRLALALSEAYEDREFECEPEYLDALLADFDAQTAQIVILKSAMQDACDLLAERTQGSPARSPGHNARLRLEAALGADQ